MVDLRGGGGVAPPLNPEDYSAAQAFGAECRDAGENGIVYPSVRRRGGECIAALFPDVVTPPVQGDHFCEQAWKKDPVSG